MTSSPSPHFAFHRLRHCWRGLLLLALALVLVSQSFGLVHRLDSVHHPAETLCEICAHADQGSAPLASVPLVATLAPQATVQLALAAAPASVFRSQPPPARGPPLSLHA
ncbi:MAG: hypothetical protein ACOY3E_12435 [Pseudomonadota bacterium]